MCPLGVQGGPERENRGSLLAETTEIMNIPDRKARRMRILRLGTVRLRDGDGWTQWQFWHVFQGGS